MSLLESVRGNGVEPYHHFGVRAAFCALFAQWAFTALPGVRGVFTIPNPIGRAISQKLAIGAGIPD